MLIWFLSLFLSNVLSQYHPQEWGSITSLLSPVKIIISQNNNIYLATSGGLLEFNTLSKSLLVTGFPYIQNKMWEYNFELFKEFYGKTQGVRRLGAAALDFCFVAMGRFEGFWEYGLKPWDICAGALIVTEAGGNVVDWDNTSMPFSGIRVLATNNIIHNEMLEILGKADF